MSQLAMPAMNFDQPWRYPESAYEQFMCAIRLVEALELLEPQMDDVLFALREDVEEKVRERGCVSQIESDLILAGWPPWRSLPAPMITRVIAQDCAMEILLKLEMRSSLDRPLAELRTADSSSAHGVRIVIKGRAVRRR